MKTNISILCETYKLLEDFLAKTKPPFDSAAFILLVNVATASSGDVTPSAEAMSVSNVTVTSSFAASSPTNQSPATFGPLVDKRRSRRAVMIATTETMETLSKGTPTMLATVFTKARSCFAPNVPRKP